MRIKLLTCTATLFASLVVGVLAPVSTVSAQSGDTARRPVTTRILCGLGAGISLTFASQERCVTGNPTTTTTDETDEDAASGNGRYVALGDSVAAGDGLPLDSNAFDARCRQSAQGYPHLVAAQLDMSLTDVACSGATAGDLVTAQGIDGPNIPAQLTKAFADGTPELITITAGANDVKWNEFIYACYQDDCTQGRYDAAARTLLAAFRVKLDYALGSIERRSSGTPPQVIVTGYYNPLSRACTAQEPALTRSEISWLTSKLTALNRSIRSEVREHDFARYVSLSFGGHDLCSKDPWVQGLADKAPLHPTAKGQERIAKRVLAAID